MLSVNAMLLSILYKAHAHEVRLILIDPKMLELSVYEGIPHLLTPVVTAGLQPAVDRRLWLFEQGQVLNPCGPSRLCGELARSRIEL